MFAAITCYVIALGSVTFSSVSALEPGNECSAACENLSSILGPKKVNRNPLSPKFKESQCQYYSFRHSDNVPSCVVYPKCAKDVRKILQIIKPTGCSFAIRAGGHNHNQYFSSVDPGGILIDLRECNHKSYDPKKKWATFGPGHTFGEVFDYFDKYDCAIVGARIADVGTGLALNGGLSYLSGEYGLACDNFRKMQIVLPNGTIATASNEENQDLFLLLKGGGGNACGIVTEYTVQCRPMGIFYAGNIICPINDEAFFYKIGQKLADFTCYNEDPKASIIGTIEFGVSENVCIFNLFACYHGPDPCGAFDNFTSIDMAKCISTMGPKTYREFVKQPAPLTTQGISLDNMFRHHVLRCDDDVWKCAFKAWWDWAHKEQVKFVMTSLDFQPVPKSLTTASKEQGGNAMNMPDGPYLYLNCILCTAYGMPRPLYEKIQYNFHKMMEKTPNAEGYPLFPNDAAWDQHPLCTFSTISKLQEIKKMCDPDGFFSSKTGGWCFDCCDRPEQSCGYNDPTDPSDTSNSSDYSNSSDSVDTSPFLGVNGA